MSVEFYASLQASEHESLYTWVRDVACSTCPECGEPTGFCYFICSRSLSHYSAAREREDSLANDALSHDEWFRLGVAQWEAVHGEPYVS